MQPPIVRSASSSSSSSESVKVKEVIVPKSKSSSSSSHEDPMIKVKVKNEVKYLGTLKPYDIDIDLPDTTINNHDLILLGKAEKICAAHGIVKSTKRERIYKHENKVIATRTTKKVTVNVLKKDAKKNSQVMTTSVGVGSLIGCVGLAGGPIGLVAGVAAGAGLGFVVGGIYIKHKITKNIKIRLFTSDHYIKWRTEAITTKIYPIFKNFVDTDKEFEDFLCPITSDIISSPMRAPDGNTYEKEKIEEYLDGITKDPTVLCQSPLRGKSFSKSQLVFDYNYCQKLIIKTQEVYEKISNMKDNLVLQHGLKAVKKNTKETINSIHDQVRYHYYVKYSKAVKKGEMTLEEREKLINKELAQWDWRIK